ncbi:MAG: extracellular solute-binding protein, partial [Clostridia bacterium]
AKSSSSREHLINIVYAIGNGKFEDSKEYLEKLCENLDGKLLSNSSDVFNKVASGQFAVGLTFEEGARKFEAIDPNIQVVYMEEGVVATPDGVYMIKNAKHKANAKTFIDYITSNEIQQYMVDNLNRRSIRRDVTTPKTMIKKSDINIINVDPTYVEDNCASWLIEFEEIYKKSARKSE